MGTSFHGSVCLLTGATGGIGSALARALAASGHRVALVARREAELKALAIEIEAAGGTARAFPTDLLVPAALDQLVREVQSELGTIGVLVNNAGVESFQHFHDADVAGIERAVAVNLTAPLLLSRLVLPEMLAAQRGVVVNISSTAGLFGTPNGAVYASTKAGLIAATRSLRMEYAHTPIRFTAVCPGFVHGAGMHESHKAEVGPAPGVLGSTTVAAVVESVLAAVEEDRVDVIVNSAPLRWITALGHLFPRLGIAGSRRLAGRYMREIADARKTP